MRPRNGYCFFFSDLDKVRAARRVPLSLGIGPLASDENGECKFDFNTYMFIINHFNFLINNGVLIETAVKSIDPDKPVLAIFASGKIESTSDNK